MDQVTGMREGTLKREVTGGRTNDQGSSDWKLSVNHGVWGHGDGVKNEHHTSGRWLHGAK